MRNLKKILALVLALVMSLSLMATASAADFTDASSVTDTYALAAKVLNGVEVFRGYEDGSFKPQNNITRAEVAAIVYRIATGDVKDTQAGIYSTWGKFNDVLDSQWFSGYVNYCANAGYIKGRDAKTFDPGSNVTGYEVLAMILRAVGYGQNGEFEGSNWAINTASIARREGVTKNVVDALLGQPATREMVAELLFQAMFVECVDYNMLTGYAKNGKNLAKEQLKLEKEPGAVVIANEWAALDSTSPLAANKTKVERADGTTWTLDWSAGEDYATGGDYATGIKDIGKAYDIYVQNGSKVISLAYSSKNDVKDNEGKETTLNTLKGSIALDANTKHFTNFADTEKVTSDYRLEVRLLISPDAIGTGTRQFNINRAVIKAAFGDKETVQADGKLFYEIVIPVGTVLTANQISVIKEIFRIADDSNDSLYIKGEVFVGTKSYSDSDDVSNSLSYAKFDETYLKHDKATVSGVDNGNWLQVVDNDADGVAEYVLLTNYDLDTIVENKSDKFYYRGLDINKFTPVEINGYTQTVGDVVLYAKIDGKAYVHKADTATATFKAVNYKDETATDTDGKVWEQSGIDNHTTLADKLVNVDELTSYNMYLDDYGYVRAYDSKINYALLTEMYPTKRQNSAWVVDRDLTVEAMLVGETAVKEYKVLNNYYTGKVNPFYTPNSWTYPGITTDNRFVGDDIAYTYPNWLQPATHMLDVAGQQGYTFKFAEHDKYVDNNGQSVHSLNSWTNVAKYTMTADGINLFTAAAANGAKPVSDYIRLDVNTIDKVTKTNPLFDIKDEVYDEIYTSALRHYVRAVDETVFFLVATNAENGNVQSVRQFTGYSNVPTLTQQKNNIRSMYAVARNTAANTDGENYWVADVIVIEMYDYDPYESVSLIYSNNYKIQNDVKYLQAIDNVRGEIGIIPNNYPVWNGQYGAYGFYGLSNVTVYDEENKIYKADITLIKDDATSATPGLYENNEYNNHGIYYGQVRSLYAEDAYSNYITLDVLDQHGLVVDTVDVRVANYGGAYAINDKTSYNEAVPLLLKSTTINNKVQVGDKVIWVLAPNNTYTTAGFIVDLTDYDIVSGVRTNRSWDTPAFLEADAKEIAVAQWNNNQDYVGNPNDAWNHEVIIGKRSDNSGAIKTAAPIQRYFAVEDYTLYVNGVEQVPTFSGIMDDSLWHIRYNLNAKAGDEITVNVTSGTNANLVLNKGLYNNLYTETIVANNIIDREVSWSYQMTSTLALEKLVSTIFASNSKIPSYINLPAVNTYSVVVIRNAAIDELTAYAKAYTDKLDPIADADLIKAINNARDNAILAVRKAETLVAAEAAVEAGLKDIDKAAGKTEPSEPVDTTEAMKVLDKAYEDAKTAAGEDADKLDAVEKAYEAAKAAVEAEAVKEGATAESVMAVAKEQADKIAGAAGDGDEPQPETTVTLNYTYNGTAFKPVVLAAEKYTLDTENKTLTVAKADLERAFDEICTYEAAVTGATTAVEGDNYVFTFTGEIPAAIEIAVVATPDESSEGDWGDGWGEEEEGGKTLSLRAARTLADEPELKKISKIIKTPAGMKPDIDNAMLSVDTPDSFKAVGVRLEGAEKNDTVYVWRVLAWIEVGADLTKLSVGFPKVATSEKPVDPENPVAQYAAEQAAAFETAANADIAAAELTENEELAQLVADKKAEIAAITTSNEDVDAAVAAAKQAVADKIAELSESGEKFTVVVTNKAENQIESVEPAEFKAGEDDTTTVVLTLKADNYVPRYTAKKTGTNNAAAAEVSFTQHTDDLTKWDAVITGVAEDTTIEFTATVRPWVVLSVDAGSTSSVTLDEVRQQANDAGAATFTIKVAKAKVPATVAEDVTFTEGESDGTDITWTVTVTNVTTNTQIVITAEDPKEITVTNTNTTLIDSSDDAIWTADARTVRVVDDKATFTIKVLKGHTPNATATSAAANSTFKFTSGETTGNYVEWTVVVDTSAATLDPSASNNAVSISAVATYNATLTTTSEHVTLPNNIIIPVDSAQKCVFMVYVDKDYEPDVTGETATAKMTGKEVDGKIEWEITVTGVDAAKIFTITTSSTPFIVLDVQSNEVLAPVTQVTLKKQTTEEGSVEYTATIDNITVTSGYVLQCDASGALTAEIIIPESGNVWGIKLTADEGEYGALDPVTFITVDAAKLPKVELSTGDENVTITNGAAFVDEETGATLEVKLPEGMAPKTGDILNADGDVISVTAGEWTEGAHAEGIVTWTLNVTAISAGDYAQITVTAEKIPDSTVSLVVHDDAGDLMIIDPNTDGTQTTKKGSAKFTVHVALGYEPDVAGATFDPAQGEATVRAEIVDETELMPGFIEWEITVSGVEDGAAILTLNVQEIVDGEAKTVDTGTADSDITGIAVDEERPEGALAGYTVTVSGSATLVGKHKTFAVMVREGYTLAAADATKVTVTEVTDFTSWDNSEAPAGYTVYGVNVDFSTEATGADTALDDTSSDPTIDLLLTKTAE